MVNRGGRKSRQSVDSAVTATRTASAGDAQPSSTVARRPRSTWDDATVACMLQLRFLELHDHFQACKTSFETAEAWVVLASELNARKGTLFESHQVQAKLKSLRRTWDEHTAANIRAGTERKSRFAESLKLMTQLYQQKLTTPLKQIGKAVPSRSLVSQPQETSVGGGARRYREASLAADAPQDDEGEDDQEHGTVHREDYEDDERGRSRVAQARRYTNDNSDAVSTLYNSQLRVAIEKQHLELFERQVVATEALARHTHEKLQVAKAKLRMAQQQVQVSRDQIELNLFAIQANPEDEVAHEYLTLKRKQARDRLKEEFFALRRKQSGGGSLAVSAAVPGSGLLSSAIRSSAAEARHSATSWTRPRRLSHELNDAGESE